MITEKETGNKGNPDAARAKNENTLEMDYDHRMRNERIWVEERSKAKEC